MKLELKHLAPYLDTNLKLQYFDDLVGKFCGYMESDLHNPIKVFYNGQDNQNLKAKMTSEIFLKLEDVKLVLRPLSEFYDINAPAFIDVNFNLSTQLVLVDLCLGVKHYSGIPYSDMEEFFMQHIDVFNLIEQDLAVSIHDIK